MLQIPLIFTYTFMTLKGCLFSVFQIPPESLSLARLGFWIFRENIDLTISKKCTKIALIH